MKIKTEVLIEEFLFFPQTVSKVSKLVKKLGELSHVIRTSYNSCQTTKFERKILLYTTS